MRLRRRLSDALRHPRRAIGLLLRIGEILRHGGAGDMLRRVRPRGYTATEYRRWRRRQPAMPASAGAFAIAVEPGCESCAIDRDGPAFVRSGAGWIEDGGSEVRPLSEWLAGRGKAWVVWAGAPVRLAGTMDAAVAAGAALEGARVLYFDHEVDEPRSGLMARFKPAWDRIQIRDAAFAGPVLAIHASLAGMLDGLEPGVPGQWRFLREASGQLPEHAFVHVPSVVATLEASAVPAADVRRATASTYAGQLRTVSASIIIPAKDRPALLARCLGSILACGLPAGAQVIVVDNGSTDPGFATVLREQSGRLPLIVERVPAPFNFPMLCNAGVAVARGDVVVLLNNDTIVQKGWLEELCAVAGEPGIGAVGPLLLYPDGLLQSAGVLLGVNRTATSALAGFAASDREARSWCASRRRVSAVLGACLAVGREQFLRVGGMDERFAISHNELDLCLRLEAAGCANVFTPFARVVHEEGATRGFEVTRAERERLAAEEALFRSRWGHLLQQVDPAHHPALARVGNPFRLAQRRIAMLPRSGWRPSV